MSTVPASYQPLKKTNACTRLACGWVMLGLLGSVAACTKPSAKIVEEKIVVKSETIPAADEPDGLHMLRNWATRRITDAEVEFRASAQGRPMASPESWATEVIYDLAVDRFADGDPQNNSVPSPQVAAGGKTQPSDLRLYAAAHGGDLAGIIKRLPYLRDLGVSVISLSPVFTGEGEGPDHCTADFTNVNPHFGSIATLRQLTAQAHAAGMRVILKIQLDGMCAGDAEYETPFQAESFAHCTQSWSDRLAKGKGELQGQRPLHFASSFPPALRRSAFFARCGYNPNDRLMPAGAADLGPKQLSFATDDDDLQDVLVGLHKYWIAMADVDGFFVTRAARLAPSMVATFSMEMRAYAARLGKTNFLVVGDAGKDLSAQAQRLGDMGLASHKQNVTKVPVSEALTQRVQAVQERIGSLGPKPYAGFDALLDDEHASQARPVLQGHEDPQKIKDWLQRAGILPGSSCRAEACLWKSFGTPSGHWLALEREAWPRLPQHATNPFKLFNGLGYLLTAWGTPVLWYGSEQGFNGQCPADFRVAVKGQALVDLDALCQAPEAGGYRSLQDMFQSGPWRLGSTLSLINQLAGVGYGSIKAYEAPDDDGFVNRKQDLFKHVQKLIAIRRSCRTLAEGSMSIRYLHKNRGADSGSILAFSRLRDDEEIMVLINNADHPVPISDVNFARPKAIRRGASQKYVNLLTMKADATVDYGGRRLRFDRGYTLPGSGVAIYVHENRAKVADTGAGVCKAEL